MNASTKFTGKLNDAIYAAWAGDRVDVLNSDDFRAAVQEVVTEDAKGRRAMFPGGAAFEGSVREIAREVIDEEFESVDEVEPLSATEQLRLQQALGNARDKTFTEAFYGPQMANSFTYGPQQTAPRGLDHPAARLADEVDRTIRARFPSFVGAGGQAYLTEKMRVLGEYRATFEKLLTALGEMVERTSFELGSELLKEGSQR